MASEPVATQQPALLDKALSGDEGAFTRLTEPHRSELTVHCYRLTGSLQEAEDLVQETMLRAWKRLETFQGRSTLRAWLYRIATNACLDALRKRTRLELPTGVVPPSDPATPFSPPDGSGAWLEPFPNDAAQAAPYDPEARYERLESITLAFIAALQHLPPRQRAALILRDVLDWRAQEVAELLEASVPAVNSALYRARRTLAQHYPAGARRLALPGPLDSAQRALLRRYVHAWEAADVDSLVALLEEEAVFSMPPSSTWYRGRPAIGTGLSTWFLPPEDRGRWKLTPTGANGVPAYGMYGIDSDNGKYQAFALHVINFSQSGESLAEVSVFLTPDVFRSFGLPPQLES